MIWIAPAGCLLDQSRAAVPRARGLIACVLSLVLASALADKQLRTSSLTLRPMPMTRTPISFTRDGMRLIEEAASRQGLERLTVRPRSHAGARHA